MSNWTSAQRSLGHRGHHQLTHRSTSVVLQEAKRRREEQEKLDMEKIKESIRLKNERIARLANKVERRKLFKSWAPKYVAGLIAIKFRVALSKAKTKAEAKQEQDDASNCIQRSWKKK